MRNPSTRKLQYQRNGSNSGAPMIGSSSMTSRVRRTAARSSSLSDFHWGRTLSAIRSRSFHKQILRQHHRSAFHLILGCLDLPAKIGVVRYVNRFAQREVFVMRNENRDGSSVAREHRSFSADLALSDELTHVGGQIEDLESLFHRRTGSSNTHETRSPAPDAAAHSRQSLSDIRFFRRRRNGGLRKRIHRNHPAGRAA